MFMDQLICTLLYQYKICKEGTTYCFKIKLFDGIITTIDIFQKCFLISDKRKLFKIYTILSYLKAHIVAFITDICTSTFFLAEKEAS